MDKHKISETSLVLTTGFLVLYFVFSIQWFLYMAVAIGLVGIFVKPLAKIIAIGWFKLADILNFVMSKVILGTVFYVILVPIAFFYRLFKKDKLQIRKAGITTWHNREYTYQEKDLKNIW